MQARKAADQKSVAKAVGKKAPADKKAGNKVVAKAADKKVTDKAKENADKTSLKRPASTCDF